MPILILSHYNVKHINEGLLVVATICRFVGSWGGGAAGASKTRTAADDGSTAASIWQHMRAQKTRDKKEKKKNMRGVDGCTLQQACTSAGCNGGERERCWKGVEEEKAAPYLHGLDGPVGVLHGADLVVNGLVWQQQLVQDLQGPGPVADRFQRHDRTTRRRRRREGEVGAAGEPTEMDRLRASARTRTHTLTLSLFLSPPHTHTLSHTLSLPSGYALDRPRPGCRQSQEPSRSEVWRQVEVRVRRRRGQEEGRCVLREDKVTKKKEKRLRTRHSRTHRHTHTHTDRLAGRQTRNHVSTRAGSPRLCVHAHRSVAGCPICAPLRCLCAPSPLSSLSPLCQGKFHIQMHELA